MQNKPMVVLCDLDGCLIDDRWRRELINWDKREFKEYHDNIPGDSRVLHVMAALIKCHKANGDKIYFTTARPYSHRQETINQIHQFLGWSINGDYILCMRAPNEEGVPSAKLKQDMLEAILKQNPNDVRYAAYDDHGDVVKMYVDMGVDCAWLVNDRVAIQANNYPELAEKVRRGYSFDNTARPLNMPGTKEFLLMYHSDCNLEGAMSDMVAHWYKRDYFGKWDNHHYLSDQEIKDNMEKSVIKLKEAYVDQFDMEQKPINVDHISIDPAETGGDRTAIININRNEKERNEELLGDIRAGWLSPDVANLPRILDMSSQTFSDRREVYGDSSDQFGRIMAIIMESTDFVPKTAKDFEMVMFFNHVVGKLVRFSNSGFRHVDSIHDVINYSALVECCVVGRDIKEKSGGSNE